LETTLFFISYTALWVLVLFQTLVLLEMIRQLTRKPDPVSTQGQQGQEVFVDGQLLSTGTRAPEFQVMELGTDRVVDSQALHGQPVVLVFVSPTCSACETIADELDQFRKMNTALLILCTGVEARCADFTSRYLPNVAVLWDQNGIVANEYKIQGTPTAVLIDPEWRILRYGYPQATVQLKLDELTKMQDNSTIFTNKSEIRAAQVTESNTAR
jgi:peroxiredoxin